MSNSSLVNYVAISPNRTSPRRGTIKNIVIHHMAGNLTVETCGNVFASSSRRASSNYGIGSDGRVGMYVEEKDRAWTTGNQIDHESVTIEVADDVMGNGWHSSDKAMSKLVELCADICKRNGIVKLNYTGDKTGNLLMHKWYQATDCPGAYLESKFPWIAEQVNKILAGETEKPQIINATIQSNTGANNMRLLFEKAGDYYKIKDKANGYYLTASSAKVDSNVDFRGFDCGDYQLWKIIKKEYKNADYTMIESIAAPGMYLSIENNGNDGKNNVKIYSDLHNQKQKFYIREETDGYSLLIHTFSGKCVTCKD